MFSLLGIKHISIWVRNQDLKKLKKQAYGIAAGSIFAFEAASGGTFTHTPTFHPPVAPTPIEKVINIQSGGGEGLVPYVPYVNPYRVPPKIQNQGLGGGAGANPAGAGGGGGAAEFEDQCPAPKPKKQQSQESESFTYEDSRYQKKKKQEDQCLLDENTSNQINEKFDSKAVKKLIKTALENQRVKQEYEGVKKRINEGVTPIDIGKKSTNLF